MSLDDLRGALAISGLVAMTGCYPTIELGRDSSTGPAGEAATSNSDVAGSTSTTTGESDAVTTSSDTAMSDGGDSDATTDATGGGDSTTASVPSTTTDTTGASACNFPGRDAPCIVCAGQQCCPELEFCESQESCSCFLDCLMQQDPGQCQAMCEQASGVAAIMTCLTMSCVSQCQE